MIRVKKSIESLRPYQNGHHSQDTINNHRKILKLDSNESTISPSPRVMGAIMQYLQEGPIQWYPDVESSLLCEAISEYSCIPENYILTFNGSDHALETICRSFLSIDDEVLVVQPTYDHFRVYAESCDACIVSVNEDQKASLIETINKKVTANCRMVYLVNPNNPTGHYYSQQDVQEALEKYPHIVFVIDEAYFEFCSNTVSHLSVDHTNLIVTRSFSKAFGLAGLRCGYLITHPKLCQQIAKIRVGKNVNALAQVAATAALKDIDYMKRYVEDVQTSKEWVHSQLQALGLEVRLTPANFLLFKVSHPEQVLKFLEDNGVYIRDRSHMPNLGGFIRLTIGDQLSMKRFWKTFSSVPQNYLFGEKQDQQLQSS